jgi:nitrogen fixation NifU-like protein
MHSERLLEHFRNPRNAGELEEPAIRVRVENPACGDILELSAEVEGGRVRRAAFRARGCTASIAAGSALTEMVMGREVEGLAGLKAAEVEEALGGLAAESKHAAALAAEAARVLAKRVGEAGG